jgi:hypothetical protein
LIKEVTRGLKAAEDDPAESSVMEGKPLLTEEEWREKAKKRDTGETSRGGSTGDHDGRGRGGGNRGRGRGRDDSSSSSGGHENADSCHRCSKAGHWARDCCSKQPMKKEEQAYATQEEDSSLLFAELESAGGGLSSGEGASHGGAGGDGCEHAAGRGQDPISARAGAGALLKGAAATEEERNIASKPGGKWSVHIVEEKVFAQR